MTLPVKCPEMPPARMAKTIDRLYRSSLAVLVREIDHITKLSLVDKLPVAAARDLRDYVQLLASMKKAQEAGAKERAEKRQARLTKVSDEALEAALAKSK